MPILSELWLTEMVIGVFQSSQLCTDTVQSKTFMVKMPRSRKELVWKSLQGDGLEHFMFNTSLRQTEL